MSVRIYSKGQLVCGVDLRTEFLLVHNGKLGHAIKTTRIPRKQNALGQLDDKCEQLLNDGWIFAGEGTLDMKKSQPTITVVSSLGEIGGIFWRANIRDRALFAKTLSQLAETFELSGYHATYTCNAIGSFFQFNSWRFGLAQVGAQSDLCSADGLGSGNLSLNTHGPLPMLALYYVAKSVPIIELTNASNEVLPTIISAKLLSSLSLTEEYFRFAVQLGLITQEAKFLTSKINFSSLNRKRA